MAHHDHRSHAAALIAALALAALGATVVAAPPAMAAGGDDAETKAEEKKERVNVWYHFEQANKLAAAGALTRSLPHYKKIIAHDPDKIPMALFNLAEVLKARKDYGESSLAYFSYSVIGRDEDVRQQALESRRTVTHGDWGKLSIDVEPQADSVIRLDDYIVARGTDLEPLRLAPGTYTLRVEATDHHPEVRTLEVARGEDQALKIAPKMMTFFGHLNLKVNQPGATVTLTPKKLDHPEADTSQKALTVPLAEPLKLPTGKYFIEINLDGYNRWIRNVRVTRNQETLVDARLTRAIPDEIK